MKRVGSLQANAAYVDGGRAVVVHLLVLDHDELNGRREQWAGSAAQIEAVTGCEYRGCRCIRPPPVAPA